jgi:hypothetical protein
MPREWCSNKNLRLEANPAEVLSRRRTAETGTAQTYPRILNDLMTVELRDLFVRSTALQCGMADNRTISQLEAEGYPWIGCECCKGTVWVPFKMLRDAGRGGLTVLGGPHRLLGQRSNRKPQMR